MSGLRICCPSTSSSCSQSRPLSGTATPSHSKPSDNFHLALQRATTARIWVFLCLPELHSLLGGHIWARKRSGRHEGGAEGLLQHHHPLGALRDLWCRFRFTTLIFLLFDQGGEAFPTVPGFLTRGRRGGSNKQGQSPAAPPAPAEGSGRRAERVAAHPPPRGTRGMPKNRRLSSTSSPQAHRGGFWGFFGGFWVFFGRFFVSGRAPRGAQTGLGAGRCISGCSRRTPNAPGGCHEAETGNKKMFRAGSGVPSTTPNPCLQAGCREGKNTQNSAPKTLRFGYGRDVKLN